MSVPSPGTQVRVHIRGADYLAEVVSATRSRATVSFIDRYGESRTVKLPLSAVRSD